MGAEVFSNIDEQAMPTVAEIVAAKEQAAPIAVPTSATMGKPGAQVLARLIEYAPGHHIALPPHTNFALIDNPVAAGVPGAARHACGLVSWQGKRLPMIDINVLLHPATGVLPAATPRYALVVAWQRVPFAPLEYGAIALEKLPVNVSVGDEAQCALPEDSNLWPQLSLSCFRHEGEAVPILDTARLFDSSCYQAVPD